MFHYILFLNTHSLFQKIIINTTPTVVENISILRTEVLINIYNLFCDSAVKQTPSWINLSERTWIITIIRDSYGSQGLGLTIDSEMNWTCEQKPLGAQCHLPFLVLCESMLLSLSFLILWGSVPSRQKTLTEVETWNVLGSNQNFWRGIFVRKSWVYTHPIPVTVTALFMSPLQVPWVAEERDWKMSPRLAILVTWSL